MASCGCDTVLTWIPGEFAATHDVYFGTAFDVVSNASVADPGGVLAGPGLTDSSLDPGGSNWVRPIPAVSMKGMGRPICHF